MNHEDALAREKYLKSGMGKRFVKNRLKRFLSLTGQATMEYFILFAVLAALTIIGGSTFFSQVSNTMDNFTESAVNTMEQPNLDSF